MDAAVRGTTPAELLQEDAGHDVQHGNIQMRGGTEQPAGDVHELARQGLSGTASQLPYLDQIQRSFGAHEVGAVKAHIGGPAAQAAEGMGAAAYATGDHVAFREAPDLYTAALAWALHGVGTLVAGGIGYWIGSETTRYVYELVPIGDVATTDAH